MGQGEQRNLRGGGSIALTSMLPSLLLLEKLYGNASVTNSSNV